MTPEMTLREFLALGATTLCYQPDIGAERMLWQDGDGTYYVEVDGVETAFKKLEGALDVLEE